MYQILLLIHVFIALGVIALVLLQQGRGATAGAGFGAGASSTVFGSRGSASFLMKVTAALGAGFFLTSLALGFIAAHSVRQTRTNDIISQIENTVVPQSSGTSDTQRTQTKSEQTEDTVGIAKPTTKKLSSTSKQNDIQH